MKNFVREVRLWMARERLSSLERVAANARRAGWEYTVSEAERHRAQQAARVRELER